MKEAKTKSSAKMKAHPTRKNVEGVSPYSKPALRSEAAKKAATAPKDSFKEYWPYLQTMLRLIRANYGGEYDQVPHDALLWIVAALNYLVDPFDLIPDKTPFLGFIDDAAVVEFVVDRTRQTLDDFMSWETTPSSG